jgi:hypothetical protein
MSPKSSVQRPKYADWELGLMSVFLWSLAFGLWADAKEVLP